MNVCFCDELPGTISLLALLPLNLRSKDDLRVFFSSGTLRCGFLGFLTNFPTVWRGAPSRIEVDDSGVTYDNHLFWKLINVYWHRSTAKSFPTKYFNEKYLFERSSLQKITSEVSSNTLHTIQHVS